MLRKLLLDERRSPTRQRSRRSIARSSKIVAEAAEFAQNSPEPDPAELYTDILVEATPEAGMSDFRS